MTAQATMTKQDLRDLAQQVKVELGISYPSDLYSTGTWDDGFYHFTRQVPVWCKDQEGRETKSMSHYGYLEIRFTDEDATVENLALMAGNRWSR